MAETTRSRFQKVVSGETPSDRLPIIEWATWWDKTVERWHAEGLRADLDKEGIKRYFGLDIDYQLWFNSFAEGAPAEGVDGAWIHNEADYESLRPYLFPEPARFDRKLWTQRGREQQEGSAVIWFTLDGFFWFARRLLGIERHLFAFYDQPALIARINADLAAYSLSCIDQLCEVCEPDFMTFAEDMSYNHGPMLSKRAFDEFLAPYYRLVVPELRRRGIKVLVDSDGQVEPMIPWLEGVGVEGILPLERMAGVDIARIRENHPEWIMIGAYDKTVMHRGAAAVQQEFERLLPVMKTGRFVPSVDHQTPPEVSIAQYEAYLDQLRFYADRAVSDQR